MIGRLLLSSVLILGGFSPAFASEPTPLRWADHEAVPKRISDALVGVNLGLDAWDSLYKTTNRKRLGWACRTGLTYGSVEVIKRLVKRERPNSLDRYSFPSGHAAMASTAAGYSSAWGAGFALTVAWGRQAGGMHYSTDLLAGAALGILWREVCPS